MKVKMINYAKQSVAEKGWQLMNYLCRCRCNTVPPFTAKSCRHVIPDTVQCDVSGYFAHGGFIMRVTTIPVLPRTLASPSCLPLVLTVLPDYLKGYVILFILFIVE